MLKSRAVLQMDQIDLAIKIWLEKPEPWPKESAEEASISSPGIWRPRARAAERESLSGSRGMQEQERAPCELWVARRRDTN